MATATSYYHGIFKPPSSCSNVVQQGVIADVTGATAPSTAASVTYTPMTGTGVDVLTIMGQQVTCTYNTSATQTITDLKAAIAANSALVSTMSKALLVGASTTTLVLTAKAPGTAGEGINVSVSHTSGAAGSLNRSATGGADRWFGQGVGAGPVDGALVGGLGALCTGIGRGTQMSPVAARTSSQLGTTAATATWTPNTSSTATFRLDGQDYTVTFNTSAAQTVTDTIALLYGNPKFARSGIVPSNDGSDNLLLTAPLGLDGNHIEFTAGAEHGSVLVAGFAGGAGPKTVDVSSYQVGAGLDAQMPAAFTALRITPTGTATQGDTSAGTVQAVGATDAVLVAASATYTPPTSATDKLYINGYPLTVTFNTSATQTVTDTKALIAAIDWMNDLLVCTGTTTLVLTRRTVDAYNAPATPVNGLGPYGNSVTLYTAATNGASLNHADLTGGATSGKGVRLVKSSGTVANGGAVISGWLNEYNKTTGDNPNTGSIATGFVVTGRAS